MMFIRWLVPAAVVLLMVTGCSGAERESNLAACKTLAGMEADYLVAVRDGDGPGVQAYFDEYRALGESTPGPLGTTITNIYTSMMNAGETADGSIPEANPDDVDIPALCRELGVDLPLANQ